MFMGEYRHTVDPKGRLIIPSRFRELLGAEFVVTRGLDGCLFVYPMDSWGSYVEELKSAPGQADREIKVPYGSRLLTLSTCIGNDADHRFLVAAVQVEEYERK